MNNQITLQQMRCPGCGSNITQFTPFKATVECPYCHQQSLNPLISTKSVRIPDRIIPFTVDKNDFGDDIIKELIENRYTPIDIFDQVSFEKAVKAYLPMYSYQGKFNTSWYCEAGYYTERHTKKGTKRTHRYRPAHGNAKGNFSILCLAYEGDDTPKELAEFAQSIPYFKENSYEYDPALLGLNQKDKDCDIITLETNRDSDAIWGKSGEGEVEKIGEKKASEMAPSDRRAFSASTQYELTEEGTYVMMPFWFVYYLYGNQKYHFILDGTGQKKSFATPVSAEIKQKIIMSYLSLLSFLLFLPFYNYHTFFIFVPIIIVVASFVLRMQYEEGNKEKRYQSAKLAFPESKLFKGKKP